MSAKQIHHLRPVWLLQQRCTYAVVLTKRLTDEQGRAIESPFIGAHPRDQQAALTPIERILAPLRLGSG